MNPTETLAADQLFKAGRLQAAIEAQLIEVKANPTDHGRRMFLFELLAFAGELDRAERQIKTISYEELELEAAVTVYRKLLDAERTRRGVFAGQESPEFLADPSTAVKTQLEVMQLLGKDRQDEALQRFAQAAAERQHIGGTLNDQPFQLMCDADDRFATVLEVMSGSGAYFWVPLEQIESLEIDTPRFPRDLLWIPAHLDVRGGPSGDVFLPALYPDTWQADDEAICLGRTTDWQPLAGDLVQGVGQRTLLVDDKAIGLLELRTLVIGE